MKNLPIPLKLGVMGGGPPLLASPSVNQEALRGLEVVHEEIFSNIRKMRRWRWLLLIPCSLAASEY